jgi:hypothetical protein
VISFEVALKNDLRIDMKKLLADNLTILLFALLVPCMGCQALLPFRPGKAEPVKQARPEPDPVVLPYGTVVGSGLISPEGEPGRTAGAIAALADALWQWAELAVEAGQDLVCDRIIIRCYDADQRRIKLELPSLILVAECANDGSIITRTRCVLRLGKEKSFEIIDGKLVVGTASTANLVGLCTTLSENGFSVGEVPGSDPNWIHRTVSRTAVLPER